MIFVIFLIELFRFLLHPLWFLCFAVIRVTVISQKFIQADDTILVTINIFEGKQVLFLVKQLHNFILGFYYSKQMLTKYFNYLKGLYLKSLKSTSNYYRLSSILQIRADENIYIGAKQNCYPLPTCKIKAYLKPSDKNYYLLYDNTASVKTMFFLFTKWMRTMPNLPKYIWYYVRYSFWWHRQNMALIPYWFYLGFFLSQKTLYGNMET